MDIDAEIKSLQQQILNLRKNIKWLRSRKKVLAPLPRGSVYGMGGTLDFDNLSHPEVIKVIKALGGKWKKEKTYGKQDRVNYEQNIDGVIVRCWNGEPPPSCRMVEYEEVIPAHTVPEQRVKRFKMVCSGQGEPLTEALAKANVPATNNQPQSTETATA